ncbi:MAG: DUF4433 domain-containing protein [Caldilineaceae bacterium SB0675_bin_29]|uniref:DUF4433 domain-containing protein n=1 Tax=Caldilineaceae bacterium SB0675_bin_29 TaxID=2605266 RepID=A0A6B1G2I1_9CHLR|nr:DUF4433 domain-containing protein [Caldilineaceae bacterium SB0675_bin_29]
MHQCDVDQLERYGIKYLYHMTHIDNLDSIAKSGLTTHNLAHVRHHPRDISDPDVQRRRRWRRDPINKRALHDYVALYFRARNPMLSRRRDKQDNLAILYISNRVMFSPGTIFTDGNAAATDTKFYDKIADLSKLDWECLKAQYWNNFEDGARKRCAEVLVPESIAPKLIENIVVYNQPAHDVVQVAMPEVEIRVRPGWFF